MKSFSIRFIYLLFVLLIFDLNITLHFLFVTEFLLLGVIFTATHSPLRVSVPVTALFGMAKDALSFNTFPVTTCIFIAVCLLTSQAFRHFKKRLWLQFAILFFVVLLYGALNLCVIGRWSMIFFGSFLFQSVLLYLLLYFMLRRWIPA